MLFDDTYKTLASPATSVFKDKGSKFISYAYPISSESQLKDIILALRAEHVKARHFCWAMRITPDRSIFKIQDDGEPSGTGGRPILNALLSADITNVVIIVVRYFGGTLLGVPGLINAYRTAAAEAIIAAEVIEKTIDDIYKLSFPFEVMNEVMRVIKDETPKVVNQQFDNECSIQIAVRKSLLDQILIKLRKIDQLKIEYLFTA
ncbi:MAG: YigZ family protein [Bacteroidota bacterium]